MGAPQLAIQFYGIVLHKNNVGLGEREAVAQEVLLKDSFFGILAKDSSFWTSSGSISRNPRTPYKLHLHAFTHPIMQRKNCALRVKMESTEKILLHCNIIIYFVALSKS